MAVAALVLGGLFFLLSGVVRPILQRRRTGDSGIRQFSVSPRSMQWWGHYSAALGGLITAVAAPIAELIGLPPLPVLNHPVVNACGVALAGLGILATFAAQIAMGTSWRIGMNTDEDTALITHGPFRFVRNPIFSAGQLTFLGIALMVPNTIGLIGLVAHVVGTQIQVRLAEEPYLRRIHARVTLPRTPWFSPDSASRPSHHWSVNPAWTAWCSPIGTADW